RIAAVADRLRKVRAEPDVEVLTGPIVGVAGDPDQGWVVTIDTFRKSHSAHVGVHVDDEERFHQALDWMKRRTTVALEGRITRQGSVLMSDRMNGVEPLSARQLIPHE